MDYLQILKAEIERRYGRQPESPADYNELALEIREVTGKDISHYTLMRIWGHVKNTSSPRQDTLSNLARYAGFAGWNDFISKADTLPVPEVPVKREEAAEEKEANASPRPVWWLRNLIAAVLLVLLGLGIGLLIPDGKRALRYETDSGIIVSEKGDTLSWTLDMGTWALTITGEGRIKDFRRGAPAEAWHRYRDSLRSVVIGEGITHIGNCAFRKCPMIETVVLPKSCTTIGSYTFDGCAALSSISLPEGLVNIGQASFWGCFRLKEIVLPRGIKRIESELFCNCPSLESCTILGPVDIVYSYAFAECKSLTRINLPEGLRRIEVSAFSNCQSLKEIIIPEGVTYIMEYAFYGCTSLTEITLPSTLNNIGREAFERCTSLRHIESHALKAPALGANVFLGIPPSTVHLTIPAEANYSFWEKQLGI